jgi:hypothetical protein
MVARGWQCAAARWRHRAKCRDRVSAIRRQPVKARWSASVRHRPEALRRYSGERSRRVRGSCKVLIQGPDSGSPVHARQRAPVSRRWRRVAPSRRAGWVRNLFFVGAGQGRAGLRRGCRGQAGVTGLRGKAGWGIPGARWHSAVPDADRAVSPVDLVPALAPMRSRREHHRDRKCCSQANRRDLPRPRSSRSSSLTPTESLHPGSSSATGRGPTRSCAGTARVTAPQVRTPST